MDKIDKDLERAAEEFGKRQGIELAPFARKFFIAGTKWQKEQDEKAWLEDRGVCFWDGVEEGKKVKKEQIIGIIEGRIAEILGDAQPAPVLRMELDDIIKRIKED